MEEPETTKELLVGVIKRMGIEPEIEGFLKEGNVCLEIRGDKERILIGKHGRTVEALEILINRW